MKKILFCLVAAMMSLMAVAETNEEEAYNCFLFGTQIGTNTTQDFGDALSLVVHPTSNAITIFMHDLRGIPAWAEQNFDGTFIRVNQDSGKKVDRLIVYVDGLNVFDEYDPELRRYVMKTFIWTNYADVEFRGNGILVAKCFERGVNVTNGTLTLLSGFHDITVHYGSPIHVGSVHNVSSKLEIGDEYGANLTTGVRFDIDPHNSAIYYQDELSYPLLEKCIGNVNPFLGYIWGLDITMQDRGVMCLNAEKPFYMHSVTIQGTIPVYIDQNRLTYYNLGQHFYNNDATYKGKLKWEPGKQRLEVESDTTIYELDFFGDVAEIYLNGNLTITNQIYYHHDLKVHGSGTLTVKNLYCDPKTPINPTVTICNGAQVIVEGQAVFEHGTLSIDKTGCLAVMSGDARHIDVLDIDGSSVIPGGFYIGSDGLMHDHTGHWAKEPVYIRVPQPLDVKVNDQYLNEATQFDIPVEGGKAYFRNDTLYLENAELGNVERQAGRLVVYNTGTSRIDNLTGCQLQIINANQDGKLAIFETVRVTANGSLNIENGKVSVNVMGKQYGIGSAVSGRYFPMTVKNATVSVESSIEAIHDINSFTTAGTALMSPIGAHFEYSKKAIVDATNYRINKLTIAPGGTASDKIAEVRMYVTQSGNKDMGYKYFHNSNTTTVGCCMFVGGNYYDCYNDTVWMEVYVKAVNMPSVPRVTIEKYDSGSDKWSRQFSHIANTKTAWAGGVTFTDDDLDGRLHDYWNSFSSKANQYMYRAILSVGSGASSDTLAVSDPVTVDWFYPHAIKGPVRVILRPVDVKLPEQDTQVEVEEDKTVLVYGQGGDTLFFETKEACYHASSVMGTQLGTFVQQDEQGRFYLTYDSYAFTEVIAPEVEKWNFCFYEYFDQELGRPMHTLSGGGNYSYIDCGETFAELELPILNNDPTREGDTFLGWAIGLGKDVDMSVFYSADYIQGLMAPDYNYVGVNAADVYKDDMEINFVGVWASEFDSPAEGIEGIMLRNEQLQSTHKILYRGQLYILRDGHWYNITGSQVK